MREGVVKGQYYFGFDNTNFVCAVDNPEVAYRAMTDEINRSSEENPLIIVAAGPLQVVGEGIARADKDKLKYVTFVSHGRWNNVHADNPSNVYWDRHSGWTWDMLVSGYGKYGIKFIMPCDQNGGRDYDGLQSDKENFDWIITSPARENPLYRHGAWDWLYSRMVAGIRPDGKFDVSDAGQIVFILTGIEKTYPALARKIMENPEPRK